MVRPRVMNVRKIAALDIALHGYRLITLEFAFGVVFSLTLFFMFTFVINDVPLALPIGVYVLFIGLNYVPLLIYAGLITCNRSAHEEAAEELADEDLLRFYNVQQLLIFVPLSMIILAFYQEMMKEPARR